MRFGSPSSTINCAGVAFVLGITCLCLPSQARADGHDTTGETYGLGKILPSHARNLPEMPVAVSPVMINQKLLYVADFYGDGLIRFAMGQSFPADDGSLTISMRSISEIVGRAALGSLTQGTSIRADKGAIVLEEAALENADTVQNTENRVMTKLGFYRQPWMVPPHYMVKKNKNKALMAAIQIAPGNPPPPPMQAIVPPPPVHP